jgi:hypothetical protein
VSPRKVQRTSAADGAACPVSSSWEEEVALPYHLPTAEERARHRRSLSQSSDSSSDVAQPTDEDLNLEFEFNPDEVFRVDEHNYAKDGETPPRFAHLREMYEKAKGKLKGLYTAVWRMRRTITTQKDFIEVLKKDVEEAPMRYLEGCFSDVWVDLTKRKKNKSKGKSY